ncbi:MAG TPA: M20/M25/M40 family metallo-hydrolase [Thermoanaerobaculia bacterium]
MRRRAASTLLLLLAAAACSRKEERPPVSRIESDTTRSAAEWMQLEPVRLLSEYVRIDTSQGKSEEAGARFLKELFDCEGIESEIVCPAPGRCNLLARIPGKRREGALLLLNHIDVADAYPSLWKDSTPFSGEIRRGYLYGRGTYDMKSLALAQALALREVKRLGVVPESDLLFLAEADEELGQRWGSKWLLANRPEWFRGVADVLNEGGTTEMVLRDVRFWGLETLQAGYASAQFRAAQSGLMEDLARRWKKISAPAVTPHPHVVLGFDLLANHLVHPLTDPLRHLDRVVREPAELAILPDRYGAFLEPRIFWTPPFPDPPGAKDSFGSYVVVSTPPGIDPGAYLNPIVKEAAAAGLETRWRISTGPTEASPYPTPFTDLLRRVTEVHFPGVPFGPVPTFGGYTTSVLYRQRGIPAYGYALVPTNITDSVRRHGNDERIFLRDYLNGVSLYADIVLDWTLQRPEREEPRATPSPSGRGPG